MFGLLLDSDLDVGDDNEAALLLLLMADVSDFVLVVMGEERGNCNQRYSFYDNLTTICRFHLDVLLADVSDGAVAGERLAGVVARSSSSSPDVLFFFSFLVFLDEAIATTSLCSGMS